MVNIIISTPFTMFIVVCPTLPYMLSLDDNLTVNVCMCIIRKVFTSWLMLYLSGPKAYICEHSTLSNLLRNPGPAPPYPIYLCVCVCVPVCMHVYPAKIHILSYVLQIEYLISYCKCNRSILKYSYTLTDQLWRVYNKYYIQYRFCNKIWNCWQDVEENSKSYTKFFWYETLLGYNAKMQYNIFV